MTKARFDSLSGDGITSGYNGFGELTSSQIVMGTLSKTLTYQYDANSKRTRLTHADAQAFTYTRDQLGRVTNVYEGTTQTSTFQLIQAAYDNRGLVDTVQRSITVTRAITPGITVRDYGDYGDYGDTCNYPG